MFKPLQSFIGKLFRRLARRLPISQTTWGQADLLRVLVQRSLAERYKGSLMGNLWPLLNQLSQLLVYTFLFSFVLNLKLSGGGSRFSGNSQFEFGLWLFAGLVPWFAFVSGFSQAATSVISQPNLVKKVVFPLALLPIVPILAAFIESLTGWMLLLVFVTIELKVLHPTLMLMPLVWVPQLLFTIGLGYLVAGLTVFLRDIPQTIGIITNLWFYLTPIVYPPKMLFDKLAELGQGQYSSLLYFLNPMAILVQLYRDLILQGQPQHMMEWLWLWGLSAVVFALGLGLYRRLRPAFADVL